MKRYLEKAMGRRETQSVRRLALAVCAAVATHSATATTLLVSEYSSGNIRAFDPATGAETTLPAHYSPVGGNSSGADGMVLDPDGRLLVNRGDGTISRRSADGNSFSTFAATGAEYLLDGARTSTHLYVAQYGENVIWRIALSNAAVSSIAGPPAANRFDGVRIGPDGRLYAVDSSNGNLFAHDLDTSVWSLFLDNPLAGEASHIEFGADGRVFLSRTIGGQARIYSYTLNTSGDYSSGLNPSSQTLIGSYGSFGAATGIRIGPDGRLYANAFNAGEVWRSTIGITAMEGTAFVSGLQEPGSLFFEADDDPPALPGVLVDFGRDVLTVASPDANGRWWNNVATDDALPPSGSFSDLINATNGLTAIAISVSGFGAGANTNGATSLAAALGDLAIANATRDSFFVASGNTATVTFSGLEPDRLYRLECFGSRDAADARSTRFTAAGLSSTSATVQTSGTGIGLAPEANANRAGLAVIEDVQPTALGVIVLSVEVDSGSFGYLGALRLEPLGEVETGNSPPTAANVLWIGAPAVGRTLDVLYDYADANGDPENNSLIEWQRDVPPFTNAATLQSGTHRAFLLSAQPGDYLRVAVTPHAAAGESPGATVYSDWKGPVAASNALAVFHVGNSFTRWGDIPGQLQRLAGDAGRPHAHGVQLADGMGLPYHWNHGLSGGILTRGTPARAELATGSWDVLVLQPMSREWQSDRIDDFLAHADLFGQLAAAHGTRVFLYHYWPYLSEALPVQDDIDAAFETVRAALASNGVDVAILPAGAAFRSAAEQAGTGALADFARADLYQDDYHPSDEGYYLSALVHFAALHRESPVGRTNGALSAAESHDDPIWIDANLAAAFQQIAWDVARQHPQSGVARGRFDDWAQALPEGRRGLLGDRHGDGLANLVRWAHGIGANDDEYFERLLTVTPNASGKDWIRYRLGADAEDAGVSVSVEWSPHLNAEWLAELPAGTAFNRTGEQIEIVPSAAWTNVYLRLRIRLPGEETP